jgi:hypothetical protein
LACYNAVTFCPAYKVSFGMIQPQFKLQLLIQQVRRSGTIQGKIIDGPKKQRYRGQEAIRSNVIHQAFPLPQPNPLAPPFFFPPGVHPSLSSAPFLSVIAAVPQAEPPVFPNPPTFRAAFSGSFSPISSALPHLLTERYQSSREY